jgi:hypothetical protein
MWRPIMSVDSVRTEAYSIDLTPFAGLLTDGKAHQITLLPPNDISDVWLMDGSLFLTTDRHAAQTSGALVTDTIAAAPTLSSSVTSPNSGSDVITTQASRNWSVSGYVDTSAGRISTTVTQRTAYSNVDTVSQSGTVQTVQQTDRGDTEVTTAGGHDATTTVRDSWSYPITMTSVYVPSSTGSGFLVRGNADQARITTTDVGVNGDWRTTAHVNDHVTASGVLQRDDSGTVVQADGADMEDYFGQSADAPCYHHKIQADHGYVTTDQYFSCS